VIPLDSVPVRHHVAHALPLVAEGPPYTVLVANLEQAARAYVREAPRVDVAAMGGGFDQFTKNTTLIRADERLALSIIWPQAIAP
jgi:hypothetical protein